MDEKEYENSGDNFTWYANFTDILGRLPEDKRAKFALGVINYGTHGYEPCFEYPLDIAFEGIRPNIDNSVKYSRMGKKGMAKRWGDKEE